MTTKHSARRVQPRTVVDFSRPEPLTTPVLRLIWRERRISRADIARLTGLSRSTVSGIVDELLPTGLIAEVGEGLSRGGRRPIVLEFQSDAFFVLGVEMGAAHVAVALTNLRGEVRAWQERGHPVRTDPEGTRALITELCDTALASGRVGLQKLVGIGVAVPSPVDPRNPDALSRIVLPAWGGATGFGMLTSRYGVPHFVDNDANLGALSEHWWGGGRGVDDFAYIKVATGLGSGHVIHGEVYRGSAGVAGEIGHMAIDPGGPPCVCGLRGCLVTFVGAQAIEARAAALLSQFPDSRLGKTSIDIQAIEEAALAGDPLALQLTGETAGHLGIAVAGLLNLMNPARVIIGGGLARLGELLLAPLRETVRSRSLVSSVATTEILTSELGPRASAVGAATLVIEAALANPSLFPARARRRAR